MQSTIMRPVIRRVTSPIPIGLTLGHLSRATSRQPLYAIKSSGGIIDVASLLVNLATSLHRFVEVCPKWYSGRTLRRTILKWYPKRTLRKK